MNKKISITKYNSSSDENSKKILLHLNIIRFQIYLFNINANMIFARILILLINNLLDENMNSCIVRQHN